VSGDALAFERRRHDAQALGSLALQQRQQQVDLEAALVKLVENHGAGSREQRAIAQRNAGRREHDPRRGAHHALVAHDIAHAVTERGLIQLRHPQREAAARDPARLDHQHRGFTPARHFGRLARSGRRREHHGPVAQSGEQRRAHGNDWKLDGQPACSTTKPRTVRAEVLLRRAARASELLAPPE
jgi:hypothetical protein